MAFGDADDIKEDIQNPEFSLDLAKDLVQQIIPFLLYCPSYERVQESKIYICHSPLQFTVSEYTVFHQAVFYDGSCCICNRLSRSSLYS